MGMKKWVVSELDKELAKELAYECDTDPIVALIASARGYTDPMALEEFLSDEPCFSSPYDMADIEKAAQIVNSHIENGSKIAVFGDYDCDGVVATSFLCTYLRNRGANCIYYIPDRFSEGYGMNISAVEKLAKENVNLLITVDNGIVCFDEINLAKSLGMDVVVTDHHLPSEALPNADAVVNPHRFDCPSEFKEICGAQVAFSLVCVMEQKEPEELLPHYADLLSVAVLADVMPLIRENRTIVKYGVKKLKTKPLTGLSAILNVAGIPLNTVNALRISFGISPRINAAGRMGKADRAVELLCADNMLKALEMANEIDDENALRQETEKKIISSAIEKIEKYGYNYDRIIVVDSEGWHSGVVGIVASRLAEKYGKPAIVISTDGEISSGSGRSIGGFSLYDAIKSTSDSLIKFGGHSLAAGVTLKTKDISLFREKINEYAMAAEMPAPILKLDCKLNPSALTLDLAESLKELEPYGFENPTPVFGIYGVKLVRVTPIGGGKHLRLIFSKGENSFQGLLFGTTADKFCFAEGDILDVAVTVDTNLYNGEWTVSVQVKAIRISGTDDDRLFREIDNFDKFMTGGEFEIRDLLPTREEVGEIYKLISQKPILEDRIKYLNLNKLGFGKTEIALMTLTELGLVKKNESGVYSKTETNLKTDLKNSELYSTLLERSETV